MSFEQAQEIRVDPAVSFLMRHARVEPGRAPNGVVMQWRWKGELQIEHVLANGADPQTAARMARQDVDALAMVGIPRHELVLLTFCGDCGRCIELDCWEADL